MARLDQEHTARWPETKPPLEDGGLPIWAVLAFACFLGWSSLSMASIDSSLNYAHTIPICLGFIAGVALGLTLHPRDGRGLPPTRAVMLALSGGVANIIAMVCPVEPVVAAAFAASNAAAGMLVLHWGHMLVSIGKGHIVTTVAIGGLVSSLAVLASALYGAACGIGLALLPVMSAVFTRASTARGGNRTSSRLKPPDDGRQPGCDESHDAPAADPRWAAPRKDVQHTAWPLPCAMLVCAIISTIFTSLLSYPFLVVSGDAGLYAAAFGVLMFGALAAWGGLAHRRNVNGFLIAVVFMLEISLLAFSSGLVERVYIPIEAVAATDYVLGILLWVLAAFLARSEHVAGSYRTVFALFIGCGSGALGHVMGFSMAQAFDIPFASMQMVAAVLLASFAVILVVFSTVEMIVMRSDLETHHVREVEHVRSEAEAKVETARAQADEQVASVRAEASQQLAQTREEAAREVEDAKSRAQREMAEARKAAARQVATARTEADQRVAEIQERARASLQITIRESCMLLAEQFMLTAREEEVMELICDGMTRAEIAKKWVVSENTVKYHLRNVYRKLDVHNSRELVAFVEESRTDFQ